jgi:hypothetical protein
MIKPTWRILNVNELIVEYDYIGWVGTAGDSFPYV